MNINFGEFTAFIKGLSSSDEPVIIKATSYDELTISVFDQVVLKLIQGKTRVEAYAQSVTDIRDLVYNESITAALGSQSNEISQDGHY
jgi:hypothetical protein